MLLAGQPLTYFDQVILAVFDLLHGDDLLQTTFGGSELAGTADVAPSSTTMTGTSSQWQTGDDSLTEGFRILAGNQVVDVASVASDTSLELAKAHGEGLADETIHRAARGFRVDKPAYPANVAKPFWIVGGGTLPEGTPGIGGYVTSPSVSIAFVYDAMHHPLRDDDPSWYALAMQAFAVLSSANGLCVPRFGNTRLVHEIEGWAPGVIPVQVDAQTIRGEPGIEITWRGLNPITTAATANAARLW